MKLNLLAPILIMTAPLFAPSSTLADRWDDDNNPRRFESNYVYDFNALKLQASVSSDRMPWSESYWPREKGSINYRWNTPNPTGFKLKSPSFSEVRMASREVLAALAPAEKWDLAHGYYDYRTTKFVDKTYASKHAREWEGVCDGWAASAIQFNEPKPMDVVNPDGLVIPFGASDIKGLASYYAASQNLGSVLIGRYCARGAQVWAPGRCNDINPGTFHVILANEIGIRNQAFIADVDPRFQTWNQPVYAYEFKVVGSARSDAPKSLLIESKMYYTDELEVSEWNPVVGTDKFKFDVLEAKYILELDYNDRIIGGEWVEGQHPDLFWKATNRIQFTGEAALLNKMGISARE